MYRFTHPNMYHVLTTDTRIKLSAHHRIYHIFSIHHTYNIYIYIYYIILYSVINICLGDKQIVFNYTNI